MVKPLPHEVLLAVNARNGAKEAFRAAQIELVKTLTPYAGETFHVDGVPLKVCGTMDRLYLWRTVSLKKASDLMSIFLAP
jgi:hypothetical protein